MKSFNTFLITETMDRPYRWKLTNDWSHGGSEAGIMSYTFTSDGRTYELDAVFFRLSGSGAKERPSVCSISFVDEEGSFNKNGGGDAFRIMATVLDIVKDVIDKTKVPTVRFDATKERSAVVARKMDSREKVYIRLVKRFAQKNGYVAHIESDNYETEFTLMRK